MISSGKESYTELYYRMARLRRRGVGWLGLLLSVLLIGSILGLPLFAFLAEPAVERLAKLAALVIFLTTTGIGANLTVLLLLVLSFERNPTRAALETAARLLFAPHPYRPGRGLVLNDIHRLKRIAEIEQQSAAWRGNYLTFSIIGLVVLAALALPGLGYFSLPASGKPGLSSALAGWPGWAAAAAGSREIVALALVSLVVLWLAGHWTRAITAFCASENENRVILLACEEIVSLFETLHIGTHRELAFHERRAVIERLGYRLARPGSAHFPLFLAARPVEGEAGGGTGGGWILKPLPASHSNGDN